MTQPVQRFSTVGSIRTFLRTGSCSSTACNLVNRAYGHPQVLEENAALPLAGGIVQHGYQCGLLWGATLAAGAQSYRLHGAGPLAETAAIVAAQRIVDSYRDRTGYIDCFDVTGADWRKKSGALKYMLKAGPVKCFRLAAEFPPVVFDEINACMAAELPDVPEPPVSCAALLARRMDLSDAHAVMAAGFAGGIGLSGGGCGALGAAIWIFGVKAGEPAPGFKFADPRLEAIVLKYLESADYEFECASVVGRRFEDVADHAQYLRSGGCAKIIEALATD